MARPQMVTRTFSTTKVKMLAVRVSTEKTEFVDLVLPRTYKDKNEMMKAAEKQNTNPDLKYVHIVSHKTEETLYGMSEAKFIANAEILPPRAAKTDAEVDPESAYADTDSVHAE